MVSIELQLMSYFKAKDWTLYHYNEEQGKDASSHHI